MLSLSAIDSRAILAGLFGLILVSISPAAPPPGEEASLNTLGGDHVRGECVNVRDSVILWRTTFKDNIRVPLAEVSGVTAEGLWDLSFKDGQTVRASWSVTTGILSMRSELFGALQCPVGELISAERAVSARGLTAPASSSPASASATATAPPTADEPPAQNETPTSSLQTLLRQSSILLRPGQWSLSTGLEYIHNRALYSPFDTRQLAVTGLIQRGITPRVEASLQWRGVLSRQRTYLNDANASPGTSVTSDTLRAGNPEVSLGTLLFGEGRIRPECLVVTGLTVPVNQPVHGGLFGSRVGLEFLKTSDPGALFGGLGWLHEEGGWERSPYQPIDHLLYHFGAAIGLNDELALGFQVQGEFRSEVRDRSHRLISPSQEPVGGRFWANFRTAQNCFIEASTTLPMNDDAHATTFNLTYIQRY